MSIQAAESVVRLVPFEKQAILDAVESAIKSHPVDWSVIALFGSRTDLAARGGDIDLYIRLRGPGLTDPLSFKRAVRLALNETIGEQKIDILVDDGQSNPDPFLQLIRKEKQDLWTKT